MFQQYRTFTVQSNLYAFDIWHMQSVKPHISCQNRVRTRDLRAECFAVITALHDSISPSKLKKTLKRFMIAAKSSGLKFFELTSKFFAQFL